MKLKLVGFYIELNYGISDKKSIFNSICNDEIENKGKIIGYLKNGNLFIACPGIIKDVIRKENGIIGSQSIVTDGTWAWPDELPYYVGTYNIDLPKDFKNHMQINNWIVPVLNENELIKLEI